MFGLSGSGGFEDPERGRRRLQRGERPREDRPLGSRQLGFGVNGLGRRIKASKWVKPAGRFEFRREAPGQSGSVLSGA